MMLVAGSQQGEASLKAALPDVIGSDLQLLTRRVESRTLTALASP